MVNSLDIFNIVLTSITLTTGLIACVDCIVREIPYHLVRFRVYCTIDFAVLLFRISHSIPYGDAPLQVTLRILNIGFWWLMVLHIFQNYGQCWVEIVVDGLTSPKKRPWCSPYLAQRGLRKLLVLFPYFRGLFVVYALVLTPLYVFLPKHGVILAAEMGDFIGAFLVVLPGGIIVYWLGYSLRQHRLQQFHSLQIELSHTQSMTQQSSVTHQSSITIPPEENPTGDGYATTYIAPNRTNSASHVSTKSNKAPAKQNNKGVKDLEDSSRLRSFERDMIVFAAVCMLCVPLYSSIIFPSIVEAAQDPSADIVVQNHAYTPAFHEGDSPALYAISILTTRLAPLVGMYLGRVSMAKRRHPSSVFRMPLCLQAIANR